MDARGWLMRAAACVAVVGWALSGCGGGVGSGGTGMVDGVTRGTVNGFGSVVVDGERFDDSQVATFDETAPGVQTQTSARLGARVEVESERGQVRRLHVEAALVGAVEALHADGFDVLGQTVRVNADAARGPVTQFGGGYAGLAAVQVGEAVEVHAFVLRNAAGFELQATRVERRSALPAFLKVSGLASAAGADGFRLGRLRVLTGGASILPAGAAVADGRAVSVLAPAQSLLAAPGAPAQLHAAQVRVRLPDAAGATVATSGVVGMLDSAGASFDLGGIRVDFRGAEVRPSAAALANGRYVQVRGVQAADGGLAAQAVRVIDGRGAAEAELKGTVDRYDAASVHFQVRGVDVDASRAEISGCPGGLLADGLFVELEGRLGPTGVIAQSVHCEDEPDDATVERKGRAGSVDATARRFVLTPSSGGTITVSWTDVTYFEAVTPATLADQLVEVEGRLVDGVLVATKVQLEAGDD